jgi:hypothetical protein
MIVVVLVHFPAMVLLRVMMTQVLRILLNYLRRLDMENVDWFVVMLSSISFVVSFVALYVLVDIRKSLKRELQRGMDELEKL